MGKLPMEERLRASMKCVSTSVRLAKALKRLEITTISDLAKATAWDFQNLPHIGFLTICEVRELMFDIGLTLQPGKSRNQKEVLISIEGKL